MYISPNESERDCYLPSFASVGSPSVIPSKHAATPTSLRDHLELLLAEEGAGSWPPIPTYVDSWPSPLSAYHTIALSSPERFVDSSSLHPQREDADLRSRISDNRAWLSTQLANAVDAETTMRLLPTLKTAPRLGFLACLAYLAHLYRWGTLPVVRIAQDEKEVPGMPEEIGRPLRWMQKEMGLITNGGSLYTMTLLNVDPSGIVYSNMRHLSAVYPTAWDAERLNAQIFYDMERLALPFYRAIASLPDNLDDPSPLLQQATAAIRAAFKLFADTVKEGKIKKDVWMSHAQGFHGWGINEFDGVSGDHSILIRTLDAFLSIPTHIIPPPQPTTYISRFRQWWYGPPETITEIPYGNDYLPTHQSTWINAVRQSQLRAELSSHPEILQMVQQLKLWRLGHTRKAVHYEDLDLPERKPMTASGGVGGGVAEDGEGGVSEMIRRLEVRLKARVDATK